jgi:hypothetical protein
MSRVAFVDRVEEGQATLILDGRALVVPASLLPSGVGEGSWVEIRLEAAEPPPGAGEGDRIRRRLSRDDDGGDFGL